MAQWELSAKPPWSKYPFKAWIDRDEHQVSIMPGVYPCVVERGGLKEGKSGDADWDWHWRILAFNMREDEVDEVDDGVSYDAAGTPTPARPLPTPGTPAVSTAAPAPVPRYEDQEIVKRRSIERQQALRLSVDYHAGKDAATDAVILAAELFYSWISGAPAEAPPDDPGDDPDLLEGDGRGNGRLTAAPA
jgi:hypothetical protein